MQEPKAASDVEAARTSERPPELQSIVPSDTTSRDLRPDLLQSLPAKPNSVVRWHSLVMVDGTAPLPRTYNYLRTQFLQRLEENDWNTVAVTSPTSASGNTLTAINLAMSIARNVNYHVLLVELNLIAPAFHRLLGFDPRPGIVDHLLHDVPISQVMFSPGIDRLVVIPAGSPVSNSSELLCSPKMSRLMSELRSGSRRRIVLFDLPSVLSRDDAIAFSPMVDCALLVVEEGKTKVSDVRRAVNYLRSTQILGIVLNRSSEALTDDSGGRR
jgi:protein-tyrosine kinase